MRASATSLPLPQPVRTGGWGLRAALGLVYLLVLAPIAGLIGLAVSGGGVGSLPALSTTLIETTLLLAGVGSAWIIAMHRFPGRDVLGVLLVLPLALPTYLAAYIVVELTDYFGPLQGSLRALFGFTSRRDYWFPEVRSLPGATLTLSLVLYPYIYLPARLMFERQASRIILAARLHGATGFRLFTKIGLPLARPAIAGGVAFALLETLNDVGAVEHFGIQTVSLTIRSIWLNRGSLPGAAQVSLATLMLVMAILAAEYALRRNASFATSARAAPEMTPMRLTGAKAWFATLGCSLPVLLGLVAPALFLAVEAARIASLRLPQVEVARALANSLILSASAAIAVAILGVLVALAARLLRNRAAAAAPRLAALGYAIPGSVLVIALLPVFAAIDGSFARLGIGIAVSGSMAAIVIAYVIRFAGIGIAQAETGLARLSPNIDHAARTLGAGVDRLAFSILAPNIRRAVGLAALFAFVDGMKELPATLLLRPLDTETLATSLYAHAAGGTFENGAFEALLLFAVGLIPVAALARFR